MVIQALGKTHARDDARRVQAGRRVPRLRRTARAAAAHREASATWCWWAAAWASRPIFPQLRAFKEAGNRTTAIIGFRSKDLVFWEDQFRELLRRADRLHRRRPLRPAGLRHRRAEGRPASGDKPDLVVAIGPIPMMKACGETTRPFGVKTMVSASTPSWWTAPACAARAASTVGGKVKFACVDGPDFDGHLVDFEELTLAAEALQAAGERRQRGLRARLQPREAALRATSKRNYKKIKDAGAAADAHAGARRAAERAQQLQGSEPRLRAPGRAAARPSAASSARSPPASPGCPVAHRHPALHPAPAACATSTARWTTIYESNAFPSVCGRVCPQESQCEAQCVIGKKVEPVAIGRLERFVGDNARAAPRCRAAVPRAASSARWPIVGSGPAGPRRPPPTWSATACEVTVFEALHVVRRRAALRHPVVPPAARHHRSRGAAADATSACRSRPTRSSARPSPSRSSSSEMGYDAVFVGVGAGAPAFLGIPGENAGQVYSAQRVPHPRQPDGRRPVPATATRRSASARAWS